MTEYKSHVLNLLCHVAHVLLTTILLHLDLIPSLGERKNIALKLSILFLEIDFYMERIISVDSVLVSLTIGVSRTLVVRILRALTTSITVSVDSFSVRGVALVRCRIESMSVGLLEVKFWAQMISVSHMIGVTILKWISSVVCSWHHDSVER